MKRHEQATLKEVLQVLKAISAADHVTFNAFAHSEYFEKEVLKPLETLSGWTANNDTATQECLRELGEIAGGKTLQERSVNLRRFIWASGGIAAALLSLIGAHAIHRIRKGRKEKNEKH